jgi:hypothetical protein
MLKNEKVKFFLSVIFVLIIVGLLTWQGIIVVNDKINNNISELKDKKISKDVYALKGKTLGQEQEAYDLSKNKIEKINNFFVYASNNDDTEFTSFFGQLDSIALQSTGKEESLSIDLYEIDRASAAKTVKATTGNDSPDEASKDESRLLKLTLKSDFGGLVKFISNLEAMPYYVYIQSISTNIDGDTQSVVGKNIKMQPVNINVNLQSVLVIKVFRKTNVL